VLDLDAQLGLYFGLWDVLNKNPNSVHLKSIFLSQFDCRCYVQNSMLNLVLDMSSQF
jgi:hypothetical protein